MRRKTHYWTALVMMSQVVVSDTHKAQRFRRASVVSTRFSVNQKLRVLVIAIAIERWRAAMQAKNQRIAVHQPYQLT